MATVKNISEERRHWNDLVNTETGRTLELDPGETAETEFPEGLDPADAFLEVVASAPQAPQYTTVPPAATDTANEGVSQ